jgi:hypothetical protein
MASDSEPKNFVVWPFRGVPIGHSKIGLLGAVISIRGARPPRNSSTVAIAKAFYNQNVQPTREPIQKNRDISPKFTSRLLKQQLFASVSFRHSPGGLCPPPRANSWAPRGKCDKKFFWGALPETPYWEQWRIAFVGGREERREDVDEGRSEEW